MPDGREKIEGTQLSFPSVSRHEAGEYECTANNGYGVEVNIVLIALKEFVDFRVVFFVCRHPTASCLTWSTCRRWRYPKCSFTPRRGTRYSIVKFPSKSFKKLF